MDSRATSSGDAPDPGVESFAGADDPLDLESLWRLVESGGGEQAADPLIGMTVGGVTLSRLIAEGGMGRVYEGIQATPRRHVAVKVLHPGLLNRTSMRRFLRETEILARLQHPWITQVFSAGTFSISSAQLPYFVMALIPDALPITEYVCLRHLPMPERLALFGDVCDAVAHAHAHGVIHRDLKPSNILVDTAGHPKVIDFGIARGHPDSTASSAMTCTGQLLGTLQYMSPEQINGDTMVDARSDVYSLGLILHELVVGRLPYDVAGESLVEVVRIIRECRPTALGSLDRGAPPGIALVINRGLQKDPANRYPDAASLAAAVRAQLAGGRPSGRLGTRARLLLSRLHGTPRTGWLAAVALLVVVIPILIITLVPAVGRSVASLTTAEVPPFAPGIAAVTFRYSFANVLDPDADRFLVEASGMKKWDDPREEPRLQYWGPSQDRVEGRLVYRFPFTGRTIRIRLDADSQCWDFVKHPGGFGRGVSGIEASRDGTTWVSLRDNVTHRNWGASWEIHENLPENLVGTEELWLRLRFLTEDAQIDRGYTVSQFARAVSGSGKAAFALCADHVPGE